MLLIVIYSYSFMNSMYMAILIGNIYIYICMYIEPIKSHNCADIFLQQSQSFENPQDSNEIYHFFRGGPGLRDISVEDAPR